MYFIGYIWQDTKTSMRSKMPQWSSTGPQAKRYRYCRVDILMALSLREAFDHCPSCDDTRSWSVSNQDRKRPNADTKLTIEAIWHRFCAGIFVLHIEINISCCWPSAKVTCGLFLRRMPCDVMLWIYDTWVVQRLNSTLKKIPLVHWMVANPAWSTTLFWILITVANACCTNGSVKTKIDKNKTLYWHNKTIQSHNPIKLVSKNPEQVWRGSLYLFWSSLEQNMIYRLVLTLHQLGTDWKKFLLSDFYLNWKYIFDQENVLES